jgi:hypothetical protein
MSSESLDAVSLRRVFLNATRELFSNPDNFAEYAEELSRFVWTSGKDSTLGVELDYVYNPANLSARHAIYVGVEDIKFSTDFINHSAAFNEDRSQTVFTQGAGTALVIRCVAPLPDEALRLATIACGYFFGMRPLFMTELGLKRFDLLTLGKPAKIEKAPTVLFESTLAINLAFNFEITSVIEGHRIKTFTLRTTVV